jgi:hypothetical protein
MTQLWHYCVAAVDCSVRGYGDRYHGNVVYEETCRCGAKRYIEASAAGRRAGHWKVPGA